MTKAILYSLVVLIPTGVFSQTKYGLTGLTSVPNAYVTDTGRILLSVGTGHDQIYNHEMNNVFGGFVLGIHSRIEAGVQMQGFPEQPVVDTTYGFNFYIDRTINGKLILIKESQLLPQVAIGFQDLLGTRLFSANFLVLSKKTSWNEFFISSSLGFGYPLTDRLLGPAQDYRLTGIFGGIEFDFKRRYQFSLEYDGKFVSYQISYFIAKYLQARAFIEQHKYVGLAISFNSII